MQTLLKRKLARMKEIRQMAIGAHLAYRPDIDGLRAIAVSLVVVFHAFPEWLPGGFVGVDVFFVISGFLITSVLLKSFSNSKLTFYEFFDFYRRRINRIFPALGFTLICCLIFGWFSLLPNEYQQLGKHSIAAVTFIPNFIFWNESGYFDNVSNTKPLLNLWSLGVEEQFYIIWPAIILICIRLKIRLHAIALSILLLSLFYSVYLTHKDLVQAFFSPASRFWELLCGGIISLVTLDLKNICSAKLGLNFGSQWALKLGLPRKFTNELLSILGLLLIAIGVSVIREGALFPGFIALLPVVGAMLIILGKNSRINKVILSNRILVNIGLMSYPIYLFHWPALAFAGIIYGELSFAIKALILVVVFVASWSFYRRVEMPFRALKKVNQSSILIILFVGIFIFSYFTYRTMGFSDIRYGRDYQGMIRSTEWSDDKKFDKSCRIKYFADQYCLVSNMDKPLDVAVYGDSQANTLYWGLSKYLDGLGENTINIGFGGCYPFYGIGGSAHPTINFNCLERTKAAYRFLTERHEIKTVYFAFHHSSYLKKNGKFFDELGEIKSGDMVSDIADAFSRSIKYLQNNGKEVILIYDLPALKIDPKRCLTRTFIDFHLFRCGESTLLKDFDGYENILRRVQMKTPIKILKTHEFINNNFPISQSGEIMYRDSVHLSYKGSMYFADKYKFLSK